jgi:hypothetical protein
MNFAIRTYSRPQSISEVDRILGGNPSAICVTVARGRLTKYGIEDLPEKYENCFSPACVCALCKSRKSRASASPSAHGVGHSAAVTVESVGQTDSTQSCHLHLASGALKADSHQQPQGIQAPKPSNCPPLPVHLADTKSVQSVESAVNAGALVAKTISYKRRRRRKLLKAHSVQRS